MSNNSLITAMFEEIKGRLSTIEKVMKKENTNQKPSGDASKQEVRQKSISAREFLKSIQQIVETLSQKDFDKMKSDIQCAITDLANSIEQLKSSIESLKCFPKKKKKNLALSELKIWKIGSITGLVLLFFCIGVLMVQNSRLKDNDLKYRYINSLQRIDSASLRNLETVFHVNRDKKFINEIREAVEEYELNVKRGLASKKKNMNTESKTSHEK